MFTLIRHLPTEWNLNSLLQGTKDIEVKKPLSQESLKKIMENKNRLHSNNFHVVLVSELIRTQETAELYGYTNYTVEPLLNELSFGIFEGKKKEVLINETNGKWLTQPKQLSFEGGESLKGFEKRIETFINKYKDSPPILIFGHGAWIRGLYSYVTYKDINKMNSFSVKNNVLINLHIS